MYSPMLAMQGVSGLLRMNLVVLKELLLVPLEMRNKSLSTTFGICYLFLSFSPKNTSIHLEDTHDCSVPNRFQGGLSHTSWQRTQG
jgi:hypothetical protein